MIAGSAASSLSSAPTSGAMLFPTATATAPSAPAATVAGYHVFTTLFNDINNFLLTYVAATSSEVINMAMPVIALAAVVWFWVFGVKTAFGLGEGRGERDVAVFFMKALRLGIVVGLAGSAAAYQANIVNLVMQMPNDVANALVNHSTGSVTGSAATDLVDNTMAAGFHVAGEAFAKASILSAAGWSFIAIAAIALLATAALAVVAGGVLVIVLVTLAVLAGLGPIFILLFAFEVTREYTARWISEVVASMLLLVMLSAIMGLFMSIFEGYVTNIRFDSVQNVAGDIGGLVFIALAGAFLMLEAPGKAARLAGGLGLSSAAAFAIAAMSGNAAMAGAVAAKKVMGGGKASAGGGGSSSPGVAQPRNLYRG